MKKIDVVENGLTEEVQRRISIYVKKSMEIDNQIRSHIQWSTANITSAMIPSSLASIASFRPTAAHQRRKSGLVADSRIPVVSGFWVMLFFEVSCGAAI